MFEAKWKGKALQVFGLEAFVEKTVSRVLGKLRKPPFEKAPPEVKKAGSAPKSAAPAAAGKAAAGGKKKAAKKSKAAPDLHAQLTHALNAHAQKDALLAAGKQKDQLLRSLVPLYVAKELGLGLNSGAISRFWADQGLKFAPPNAAKALRQKAGFAKAGKAGQRITPSGVQYVEDALAGKQAA